MRQQMADVGRAGQPFCDPGAWLYRDFWHGMLGVVPSPNPTAQPCAGRVKTLHPGVHGGILARRDLPGHLAALDQHGIALIDLVRPQRSGSIMCGDM